MTASGRANLFLGLAVVLALVFIRLGIWQVSRLQEKRAINAVAAERRGQPVVDLDDPAQAATVAGAGIQNRRVMITGRYDAAAEVVLRGQIVQGVPGVRFVTPLRPLRGDTAILVQRGYVSSPDAQTIDPAKFVEDGVVRVAGIGLTLPDSGVLGQPMEKDGITTWRRVDLAALRARLPYPVAGYYILQTPDSALPKLPRRDDAPAFDEGAHLSYAIQWFAFATIALVGGFLFRFRRPSER